MDEQHQPADAVGQAGGKTGCLTDADVASLKRIFAQLCEDTGHGTIVIHVQKQQAVRFEKNVTYLPDDLALLINQN